MSANVAMAEIVNRAVVAANDAGARYGFEMAKLTVVGLLYDEMAAAAGQGRDVTTVRELVTKVQALQMPKAAQLPVTS
jgi:hypothetical protein